MKIFQVITVSEYGGAQTLVANLVKSLSPEHEVFVLYGGNGEAWAGLGDNFKKIRLNSGRKEIGLGDIILFFKLVYYRFKYNPDIIHLHSSKMTTLGRIVFSPAKVVCTMHGFESIITAFRKFLFVEKLLKKRMNKMIAVSQFDVKCLAQEGIRDNVICIYNGIEDKYPTYVKIQNNITSELETIKSAYPKIVMCIARISKQKKFDLFLDVARRMPQHAFVWIGNKKEMPDLPANVYCLGEAASAYNYLPYADVFILPSNYEGLPISILEAISFAVPVVSSAVGGVREILDDTNGFAVENDPDLFVDKINYILSDGNNYNLMARNARKTYLEKFTIGQMIDKYMDVFNSIVSDTK